MPATHVAGTEVFWQEFGHGPQTALLIHCSLAQSGVWAGLAASLDDALAMTAFDLPGHGKSAPWDGCCEIQKMTTDIAAELLRGPSVVIGHSFGATVALRLAVERPDLVTALVMIEPVFFAVARRDDAAHAMQMDQEMRDFEAAMQAGNPQEAAREFTRIWGDGTPWSRVPNGVRDRLAGQMPLIAAAQGALYDDVGGILDRLDAVTMPTLVLHGDQSPNVIPAINAGLRRRLDHAEGSVIEGAGHMAPLTHPQQTATAIRAFLGRHGMIQSVSP